MHHHHHDAKKSLRDKVHAMVGHTNHHEHGADKAARLAPAAGGATGDRTPLTVNGITTREACDMPGSRFNEAYKKTMVELSTPVEARKGD